jgi:steroid 5-alpha reductase family enzyme
MTIKKITAIIDEMQLDNVAKALCDHGVTGFTIHPVIGRGNYSNSGWYARCRHPQYVAFILIMFGFLLQWPTILTLVMFPILVVVYVRLANKEEQMVISEFGDEYLSYMSITPAWIPKFK